MMGNSEHIVELEHLYVSYNGRDVLCDINLEISRGEMVGICGPNGSGKTTLLKSILGLVQPKAGNVRILGKPLMKENLLKIGYMPQLQQLKPEFPARVKDVVMMGRYGRIGLLKRPRKEDLNRVNEILKETDLLHLADRPIGQLSGGQLQRVMLAQALARDPLLILLDEPTSALDIRMTIKFMEILKSLNRNYGLTIVAVHHDLQLLRDYTTRIICIDKAIEWEGDPKDADLNEALLRIFFYKTIH
ncbi:MAG: metal ABC transporter ATP-binding protein [Methanobacteriota archaeon]|nr:MAG: metal ABC transporter ATP-binding protein [Euryarchaeota archaeon]